ncbi:MAG: hypothetical protein WBM56_02115 [Robiginitalea sp.]|uniref:hypothetical protein n=1 Tax=Robiginitalea sp. TaxID=1902411 RepID=UPI003C735545
MKDLLFYCRPLWFFQKKIAPPALFISVLLGLTFFKSFSAVGLIFLLLAPFWHYYIYEVRYKQEYYFYFNLGLTRLVLWVSTLTLAVVVFFLALVL